MTVILSAGLMAKGGLIVLAAAGAAMAQASLPSVNAKPMDIGLCKAPTSHEGTDRILTCSCPAKGSDPNHSGSVWGTDVYTADSYICKAARHAGAIGATGGQVVLQMLPGQASYRGSSRNSETTRSYGRYRASYRFVSLEGSGGTIGSASTGGRGSLVVDLPDFDMSMVYSAGKKGGGLGGALGSISRSSGNAAVRDAAGVGEALLGAGVAGGSQGAEDIGECKGASKWHDKPGKLLSCTCPASPNERSPIWGTGTYSGDSYICKAALHAGAITRSGGRVAIQMMPDQQSYAASVRNDITSMSYGPTRRLGSYRFVQ